MLVEAINYIITMFSSIVTWVFTLELVSDPKITVGHLFLGFATLALVILLIFKPILDRSDK